MKTSGVTGVLEKGVDTKVAKTVIIAHDFEAAATRCKAKVKAIATHCRSQNRRFRFAVRLQTSQKLLTTE
jgi:hypothetical protein